VYVGKEAWKGVKSRKPSYSTILCSTNPSKDVRAAISDRLHNFGNVSVVTYTDDIIDAYRKTVSVVDMIVVVLIVSAGLLAFIVLYNLTNINISERVREIASLKVLGFTKHEIYAYFFREIALLSILGDLVGMVLGVFLAHFVVVTA
jgi:putative ABC transport system permease protein